MCKQGIFYSILYTSNKTSDFLVSNRLLRIKKIEKELILYVSYIGFLIDISH